ncbi:MAG: NACHT domain-containing protein [Bacteroidota bacterium]
MNTRDTKLFNCYTQSQQGAARILFTVWLLTSCSPDMALAAPKTEGAMVPATTATSPGDPSLASTPPTPPPGGILQLPPDSPGPRWGSSPAIEAALQRQPAASLRARTIDRLASRFSRPRPQVALRTQAGPVAEGDETSASSSQHPAAATAPGQVPELTQNLTSLYQADDKLPKLIEDDDTPEQRIADYYVKLQAVISESGAGVESAAARDKVVGEKRAIQIKEIFDALEEEGDKPAGRVLLLGGAGIGKTTLMHYISHQWAKGELWKDKYAYLFRVRLKELLNDSWQSAYDIEDLGEHPLACFIHHCLRNQRAQLPRSERNTRQLCKLEKVKSLLEDPASQPSTLLLVDGYDEIASQRQQGIVKEIVDAILDQRQVIMTSRPNAVSQQLRASFDRQVENQGLDQEGIGHYIDLQFGEKQKQTGQALKEFLTKNKQIIGMCEVPINTALLCIIWQDEEIREKLQKQVGEDFKLGALYEELVLWLGRRYLKKFQGRDHKELTDQNIFSHPEVKTLKEVAYRSFTGSGQEQSAGTLGIAGELIANTAQEQGTKIESVYSYGLFRAEGVKEALKDKTHYFIHLTFQEYLTALRLSEKLSAPQGEGVRAVARHIAEHRNEPRYLMTLKFLAGLVSKSDNKEVVQRFWEAVSCNVEGVLELGVASKVGLLMHLLAQSTLQGELDERIPNREQLQELVDEEVEKDLARWQAHLIDSGYQSAALVKKLRAVIYQEAPQEAAISSLSSALEIGLSLGSRVVEEEQSLAGHLEKLLDSSVWQVQGLAASKLSQALDNQVDPEQASGLLAKLLSLYGTANTAREALLCLSRLTELSPAIVVEELLKRANQGIEGSSALKLCAKLVEVNPELAEQVLATAQTGLQDEDEYVREEALTLTEAPSAPGRPFVPSTPESPVAPWSPSGPAGPGRPTGPGLPIAPRAPVSPAAPYEETKHREKQVLVTISENRR